MPVWAIAILALPVFLFPMTYWFCVWVKRPVGGTFDPTSPTQIEEFYDKVISKRVVRIRWLCCILFVCSLSVGLSLSVYKWVKVDSPDKIRVKMEKTAGNIFVSGMFLEEKFVRVRVSRPTSAGPDTTIYLNTLRTFNKAIYLCIQDTAKNWPVRVVVGYSDRLDGSTQEIQVSQQFQEK